MTRLEPVKSYLANLSRRFGDGWNRFWFTPSDPLTLCAIRVLTGALALYLHATLGLDLLRFFGPDGWLPVDAVEQLDGTTAYSYLSYLNSPGELWGAHLIGAGVLALFTIGLFTRLTSVLALVVMLSDIHRAPMLTTQCEPVLTMIMCYLCLGPAGAWLSLDALRSRRKDAERAARLGVPISVAKMSTAATIATRLIQVHLALLVATMGLSKLMGDAWWSGTAVWLLIVRPESRLVDFTWLNAHPFLIDAWTHAIVLFELAFPILIWNSLARPILLVCGVVVWISLALLTGQVAFALVMLIGSLAYVPPDALRACWGARFTQLRVLPTSGTR